MVARIAQLARAAMVTVMVSTVLGTVVCTEGCSPLLYLVLQARSRGGAQPLSVGQPVTGSTAGAGDSYSPECMSEDARDEAWAFTAPTTGQYRFVVRGDYDTVLAVEQDGGHELACNDDHGSTRESLVDVRLQQAEHVTVVVDGYHGATGSYTLQVDPVPALPVVAVSPPPAGQGTRPPASDASGMAARCEAAPALTPGVVTGTVDADVGTASLTCGSGGPGGDVVYRFVAPSGGTLGVAESSFYDALLELRDGCAPGHAVLACNDDSPDTRHAALSAHVTAGTYYLVVDTYGRGMGGPFALLVNWTPDAVPMQVARPPVQPTVSPGVSTGGQKL